MEQNQALGLIAQWLLAQNSLAARLLSRHPAVLPRLVGLKPGRLPSPPARLTQEADEETALSDWRAWLTQCQLSLMMAALSGRATPLSLADRLARITGRMVELCLEGADAILRRRVLHPLLLPHEPGPGPVVILNTDDLAGREMSFNQPLGLLFLFTRRPPYAPPHREEDFQKALGEHKQIVILKEYVLKLTQRTIDYLTLDSPQGPGLNLQPPRGATSGPLGGQGAVGPQIISLGRFLDFFRHQAGDAQLLSLTRLAPLAGQPKLARDIRRFCRDLVMERPWDVQRLAACVAAQTALREEVFDPVDSPGGLKDLGLLLDALLLQGGLFPLGPNRERLRRVAALGVLSPAEAGALGQAHLTLLKANLALSLLGRRLPGHSLETAADLDAVLALWPHPPSQPGPTIAQARETVSRALKRFR